MADKQLEGGLKEVKASIKETSNPTNVNEKDEKVVGKDELGSMNTPAETQSHAGNTPQVTSELPKKVNDSQVIATGLNASVSEISIKTDSQSEQKDNAGSDQIPEDKKQVDSLGDGSDSSSAGEGSGATGGSNNPGGGDGMASASNSTSQGNTNSSGGEGVNPSTEIDKTKQAEKAKAAENNKSDEKGEKKETKVVLNEKAKGLLSKLTFSKKVDVEVEKIESEASASSESAQEQSSGMDSAAQSTNEKSDDESDEAEYKKELSDAEEGKKQGELVGKTRGYGKLIKDVGGEMKVIPFPTDIEGNKVKDAKAFYEEEKKNLGKMPSAYQDGFYEGYNKGYAMGQRLKSEEKKAAAAAEEAEKMKDPNFKLGRVVGTQLGIAKAKKEDKVKMTLPNGTPIEESFATIYGYVMANKGPLGNERDGSEKEKEKKETVFQNAFFEYYNKFYSKTLAAVNKKPDQSELMADEHYKKGYVPGNQLARGEGDQDALKKLKEQYSSKESQEKAKKDEDFNKEMTGFFAGYNAGYGQKMSEKAAAKKKADDDMKNDPVYKFARTAGIIIGTLKSAFKGEDPYANASKVDKLKAIGFDMQLPAEVKEILTNKGAQGALVKAMMGTDAKKIGYFDRGYQMGFNEGFAKGPSKKREVADSSVKNHPDYKRFIGITKKVPMSGVDQPVQMNLGQLAAFSKYTHGITPKEDASKLKSLEKTYEEAVSAVKDTKSPMFEDAFYTYYNQTYVDFQTGKGELGKKLKEGQQNKEHRKNAADRLFGHDLAMKFEEKKAELIKNGKGRGKYIKKLKENVKILIDDYIASIKKEVNADTSLSEIEKKELIEIREIGVYRGYGETVLANSNTDLQDQNDKAQVNQRVEESAKKFDSDELKKKAKELAKKGAGEGFTAAYEKQKNKAKKGVQPETVTITNESEVFVKLKKTLSKWKTKDGKTVESTVLDELMDVYKISYSGAPNKYGASLGNQLIIAYFNGYQSKANPNKMIKKGGTGLESGEVKTDFKGREQVAFEKGESDAVNEKEYADFKKMAITSGESNLKEDEREVSYTSEQAKEDVTSEWSLILHKHFKLPYKGESSSIYDANSKKIEIKNDKGYTRIFKEREKYLKNHLDHCAKRLATASERNPKAFSEDDIKTYQKDYRALFQALVKKIEKKQNGFMAYFIGLSQSLADQLGKDQPYPNEILVILDKLESNELSPDVDHPKFLEGENDGVEWAMQVNNGMMSIQDILSGVDKKMETDSSGGIKIAKKTGEEIGNEHANSANHGKLVPQTLSKILKEKKKKSALATLLKDKEKESDEEQAIYIDHYWLTKDQKGGALAGHAAAMFGAGLDQMSLFYQLVKNDNETVTTESNILSLDGKESNTVSKRGVRDKNVFEGAFVTARNAVSGQDTDKLKEEFNKQEEEKEATKDMSTDEKKAYSALKDYKEQVDEFANSYSKLVAYSQIIQELYPSKEAQEEAKKNKKVTELYTSLGGKIDKLATYSSFNHKNKNEYIEELLKGIGELTDSESGGSSSSGVDGGQEKSAPNISDVPLMEYKENTVVFSHFEAQFSMYFQKAIVDAKSNLPLLIQGQNIENKKELSDKEVKRVEAAMDEMVEAVTDDDDFHHHTLSGMPYITDLISVEQKIDESIQLAYEKYELLWELDMMLFDSPDHSNDALEHRLVELQQKKDDGTISDEEEIIFENLIKSIEESSEANNDRDQIKEMIKNEEQARLGIGADFIKHLLNKIKFNTKVDESHKVLEYLDGSLDKLTLSGNHAFKGPFVSTSGGSNITIEPSAEDFTMVDMSITINKGQFNFSSTGFEYVDKKNAIKLLAGNATVPNLDAGSNDSNATPRDYSFKNLTLDLKKGIYDQLKEKQNQLTTKMNAKSKDKRAKSKIPPNHIDTKKPSDIKLKSDS